MPQFAKRLTTALANTTLDGEAAQTKAQLGLGRSKLITSLQTAVKQNTDVNAHLADPPLPGKASLAQWFPEKPSPRHKPLLVTPRPPATPTDRARHIGPPSNRVLPRSARVPAHGSARPSVGTSRPGSARSAASARQGAGALRGGIEAAGTAAALLSMPGGTAADGSAEPAATDAAMRSVLAHWMDSYDTSQSDFASRAVFVEMRLRQALACSASLGVPNVFRCAIVCDAWERVAPLVGPFESVLSLLWTELLRCMYADFSPDMIGAGAKAYAARMPYFGEVIAITITITITFGLTPSHPHTLTPSHPHTLTPSPSHPHLRPRPNPHLSPFTPHTSPPPSPSHPLPLPHPHPPHTLTLALVFSPSPP